MKKTKLKLTFNSPVVLWFVIICFATLVLNRITSGGSNRLLFSVYRASLLDVFTYFRFFGHVLGHANWQHFMGNMMLLLVVGPLLEEKYGPKNLIRIIVVTALATGLFHFIVFPGSGLLGASGVVFAFILLSSVTEIKSGEIPITLILVAVLYLGQEVVQGIFVNDNVSNITHIIGGLIGGAIGMARPRRQ